MPALIVKPNVMRQVQMMVLEAHYEEGPLPLDSDVGHALRDSATAHY